MKTIKINVTQKNIDDGARGVFCPLEWALKDAGWQNPTVGYSAFALSAHGRGGGGRLTQVARRWIRRFDAGEFVKPRTFRLGVE